MTNILKWEKQKHNEILQGQDFFISYNKSTGGNIFTGLGNMFGGNFKDGEETALMDEKNNIWMILEGDFRKEYSKVFSKGLDECVKVYKKNIEYRSNWSTD